MANVYFISDLHLGHKNAVKWRTQYMNEQDMYQDLFTKWHATVTKRDIVYVLGDCVLSEDRIEDFKTWRGRKILICGNHDRDRLSMKQQLEMFDDVYGLLSYKEFWLSHAPIHSDELRGKFNIHGHTHSHNIDDFRYLNVSVEQFDGKPIELVAVRDIFSKRIRNATPWA